MKTWGLFRLLLTVTTGLSLLACIAVAVIRSNSLVSVTITAMGDEPNDHGIPMVLQSEALPDYELALIDDFGNSRYLGTKPNASAANGLTWKLDEPALINGIAAIRLQERDALVSDQLAEVHVNGAAIEENGYRFEFECSRTFEGAVSAFFMTPIGLALCIAFGIFAAYLAITKSF